MVTDELFALLDFQSFQQLDYSVSIIEVENHETFVQSLNIHELVDLFSMWILYIFVFIYYLR